MSTAIQLAAIRFEPGNEYQACPETLHRIPPDNRFRLCCHTSPKKAPNSPHPPQEKATTLPIEIRTAVGRNMAANRNPTRRRSLCPGCVSSLVATTWYAKANPMSPLLQTMLFTETSDDIKPTKTQADRLVRTRLLSWCGRGSGATRTPIPMLGSSASRYSIPIPKLPSTQTNDIMNQRGMNQAFRPGRREGTSHVSSRASQTCLRIQP